MQLVWFIMLFLQRLVTGLQNMYGYHYRNGKAKSLARMYQFTVAAIAIGVALCLDISLGEDSMPHSIWAQVIVLVLMLVGVSASFLIANGFYIKIKPYRNALKGLYGMHEGLTASKSNSPIEYEEGIDVPLIGLKTEKNIHLWTGIATNAIAAAAIAGGVDLIYILISVIAGQVVQHGFINKSFNRPFLDPDEVPKDPTAQMFGIPTFDSIWRKVVRNGNVRLALALAGVVYIALNELVFNFDLSVKALF